MFACGFYDILEILFIVNKITNRILCTRTIVGNQENNVEKQDL